MRTYVTFGQDHRHIVNGKTFDKDCVAVIEHEKPEEGRALAFEFFGPKFCFEHTEEEFNVRIPPDKMERYFPRGLIPVNFQEDPLEWSKKNGLEEF